MAVRIEKGGWILIFLIGVALVAYSLNSYGVFNIGSWLSKKDAAKTAVDPSKPLPTSGDKETNQVRVRVNIWVGCVGVWSLTVASIRRPAPSTPTRVSRSPSKLSTIGRKEQRACASNNVEARPATSDVWAKDYAQLQEKGFNARAVFMVDWSRGADGAIGRQGINSIEDLAGKTVAYAPYTPSHFLLWNGLKSSGLSTEQRNEIFTKAVHTKDGIEPATLFAQQKVDAAVAWDPDMSDAVAKRKGSNKIYDTRIANRLIADILVVSDRFAASSPQTVSKFLEGWLEGVEFIRKQPIRAHTLIGTIKDFNIPADLAKTMLEGVRLSDYADNKAFFGTGSGSDYNNILSMAQDMYRELRVTKRVPDVEGSVDRRYLAGMEGKFSSASTEAPIEYKEPPKGATPIATQRRSIYFETSSATMSPDSRRL